MKVEGPGAGSTRDLAIAAQPRQNPGVRPVNAKSNTQQALTGAGKPVTTMRPYRRRLL